MNWYWVVPVFAVVAYLSGTAIHEITHWLVARGLGADVTAVSLLPPTPHVSYDPPTSRVDDAVQASTVVAFPLLAAVLMLSVSRRDMVALAALSGFLAGYLPNSRTDWAPFIQSG